MSVVASLRVAACGTGELTDAVAACLVRHGVRFRLPVILRDACACACVSNGVDVHPRCGCDAHDGGAPYCYTAGVCDAATPSSAYEGAYFRLCTASPPPPPAPYACSDPLFPTQWHHVDARASSAWGTTRGAGVTVVVIDDGVQYGHPDLDVDRARSFGWDTIAEVRTPSADAADALHGTAVAGLVAAVRGNGRGGCGVAPDASLVAVRLLTDAHDIADDGFAHALDEVVALAGPVVVTNSWGPYDDGRVDGPRHRAWYHRIDAALDRACAAGRVILFAAGNGGVHDNANDDGFAAHPCTLAVSAVDDGGRRAPYAEFAACVDVVAPSSGGVRGIVTTDLVGASGYTSTNATTAFGGTSAATPLVAGVAALVLSVRPDLSTRDVRALLHATARVTHADDPDWLTNAAGARFSPWYGFGVVDAAAAVAHAENWTVLPRAIVACSDEWAGALPLGAAAVHVPLLGMTVAFDRVEVVVVDVDVVHPWRGDVVLTLVSPSGTAIPLTRAVPTSVPLRDAAFVPHAFMTPGFSRETSRRDEWGLRLVDGTARGYLRRARVCVHGVSSNATVDPGSVIAAPAGATTDDGTTVVLWTVGAVLVFMGVCLHVIVSS